MFQEDILSVATAAKNKWSFLKDNPMGYLISAMMSGMFIGFGSILIGCVAGMMTGIPFVKLIQGFSFCVGLSLVIIAGAELFTGNNFVMAVGSIKGTVTWKETAKVWLMCYVGNWIGSILAAVAFYASGLNFEGMTEAVAATAYAKMTIPLGQLFIRAIFCNILVCLAVWSATRAKSESGKLIMVFWCIYPFVAMGFEHSVANMSTLTMGLLNPAGHAITLSGYFYNLFFVTIGNMIGGIVFVALPYLSIARDTKKSEAIESN